MKIKDKNTVADHPLCRADGAVQMVIEEVE